ncbi:MAG: gluconolactonase [Sphingobium sp.]|nr:MAG: gluconolactonase [Sphingobium sp.]
MTTRRALLGGLAGLPLLGRPVLAASAASVGRVIRIDPALDRIVDPAASITVLGTGFRWAEGPAWIAKDAALLFSDPPANAVYRWTAAGGAGPFLSPAGLQGPVPAAIREAGLNGLAIGRDGALLAADSGTRAIVRVDLSTRRRTIIVDGFEGKRFNSPNDLCVAPDGGIYFTDPTYGLAEGDSSPLRELDFCGLYHRSPGGTVTAIDRRFRRPNGVALSPDGRTLYLALSDEKQPEVLAYTLDARGLPTAQHLFRDMRPQQAEGLPGLPDGIKTRGDGTVFATGPGGVHVCTAEGVLLGIVATGKSIANCCIDEDGHRLFLTSSDMLAMVPLIGSGTKGN